MTEMSHVPLFARMCGLRGENLSTIVLQELIQGSDVFAEAFFASMRRAAAKQNIALPDTGSIVDTALCEVSSSSEAGKKGRLDLAIVTDSAVIGVENKFYADFQDGQPAKYFSALSSEAHKDPEAPKNVILALLAPKTRFTDVQAHVLEQARPYGVSIPVLQWESVIDAFVEVAPRISSSDPARVIWDYFHDFLSFELGNLDWVPAELNALRAPLIESSRLNKAQEHLYGLAWRFLRPAPRFEGATGTRTDARRGYAGAYCFRRGLTDAGEQTEMWFGFANSEHFGGDASNPGVHLVLCMSQNIHRHLCAADGADALRRLTGKSPDFREPHWYCYEFPIDERLANANCWHDRLAPFIDALAATAGPANRVEIGFRLDCADARSAANAAGQDRITE